jgi:hypothetical protein
MFVARHLAGVAIVLIAPAAVADGVDPQVQKHFDLGNQLYEEGRYDDALVEYDKAYALSKNWKILFNRGQVLVMLRRDPEAIEAFEQYLKQGGAEVPDDRRKSVEADLEKLRQRLAKVTISNAPSGVELAIDGRAAGTAPLKGPIVVGAGKHVVTARRGGNVVFSKEILIAAGDSADVHVEIAPEPKKEPPPPPKEEGGLPIHAFNISLAVGLAPPLSSVVRGRLAVLGAFELGADWRPHPVWSVGFFVGAASGKAELKSEDTNPLEVERTAQYGGGIGGVRAKMHLLRDKYFDGWIGGDLGVWRETWTFSKLAASSRDGFEWSATSPAIGLLGGIDFPIAKTWALGASARVFGTAVRSGDRFGCGANDARCDSDSLPGGGGLGVRGFFEVAARLTWSIVYASEK